MFDMFYIVFFNDEEIKCIELNWIELKILKYRPISKSMIAWKESGL